MKLSLVAKSMIVTTLFFFAVWISYGVFEGGWDGVLLACIITVVVAIPIYFYGEWLAKRIAKSREEASDT